LELFVGLKSWKIKIMTSIELKKIVLQQISEINDISFLNALHKILETKVHSKKMKLNTEQLNEILFAKKEIEHGLFADQDTMDKSFEQWQREK
jgi:hypothetical protein